MFTPYLKLTAYCLRLIACGLLLTTSGVVFGQMAKIDTARREAPIQYILDDNKVNFAALTPPLQQVQGAPQAFYTYHWEFGDGQYSNDPKPVHSYKKEGEYKAQLWTTNNYDNGKPPPSRPQKIPVKKISYQDNSKQIKGLDEHNGFRLQLNRQPVPEEEIVVIVSYKNQLEYASNGKIYLFFNEDRFKSDNFSLGEARMHNGEREVQDVPVVASLFPLEYPDLMLASASPSFHYLNAAIDADTSSRENLPKTLKESKTQYRNSHIIEFDNMQPGEERNVFYSFRTTPEMIKDTSAIITIRGVYVPDRAKNKHKVKELEMEIVTSHDPNKMSISDTRINYRFVRNKELQFKVRFQNNGEGPAKSIQLKVDVPEMYNKSSLKVVDMYPKCPICPDSTAVSYSCLDTTFVEGKIIFHIKNIYLPGSNQKNVEEKDSTRGFVKYTLRFNKHIPKKRTLSRTAIIFDKNEPIYTNYSTTRFSPGISIGAKAGFNYFPTRSDVRNYFVGATISPYKSYRGYFQAEVMVAQHTFSTSSLDSVGIPGVDPRFYNIDTVTQQNKHTNIMLYIVPISYKYNLNRFISIGAGLQASANLSEKEEVATQHKVYQMLRLQGRLTFRHNPELDSTSNRTNVKKFTQPNVGVFGEINIGSSRIGPMVGARYIYNLKQPYEQWQFYALWKF